MKMSFGFFDEVLLSIATIEELTDVSTDVLIDYKFASWMVLLILRDIKYHII